MKGAVFFFCLVAAATAVPAHLRDMQQAVVHPELESLMEEAARLSMRSQSKMLKPVMDVVKGKVDGKEDAVQKALAVKVHRFELATAITMLSQGMKVDGKTWNHHKENLVFPIELLGRLLVFAHDVFNADGNAAKLGNDLGGWICDLFRMPGGTLRDDNSADWKNLLDGNLIFKSGLFPKETVYDGQNKAARKKTSLGLIRKLLDPNDANTNHRTLYYMLSKLTEAGEEVIGDGNAAFGKAGVSQRHRWSDKVKQTCVDKYEAAKKQGKKFKIGPKCWEPKPASENDKGCFRWTVIALHEKTLTAPKNFASGFSMQTLSNMYTTLAKCKMNDDNTKKKNILAPACDDWMQNARPASKCPFHLIKAFAMIQKMPNGAKKDQALKILGDYLAKGWFRYKPGNKCKNTATELKTKVLAALDGTPMKTTLENGLFKDEKDGFQKIGLSKMRPLGDLLAKIGDVGLSQVEKDARGAALWGVGGTAWYLPQDEWDLQYNGKPLMSPRFRRFMKNYIIGSGMLSAAGPSGTSAEMETLGEYFGLSKSAFFQCKAFESLLAQMVMYNHHSYIEVQEAIARTGPGKTENDPEVVIDVHKDRNKIIDMHQNLADETTKLDDPFAILQRCDKHLKLDTVKPITVKFDEHNVPTGAGAPKNAPAVASTPVWADVVKMFHKISNGGDQIFKDLNDESKGEMPFRQRMGVGAENQKNLWKITEEGPGKAVIESKVCAIQDFKGTSWETVFHCKPAQQKNGGKKL